MNTALLEQNPPQQVRWSIISPNPAGAPKSPRKSLGRYLTLVTAVAVSAGLTWQFAGADLQGSEARIQGAFSPNYEWSGFYKTSQR